MSELGGIEAGQVPHGEKRPVTRVEPNKGVPQVDPVDRRPRVRAARWLIDVHNRDFDEGAPPPSPKQLAGFVHGYRHEPGAQTCGLAEASELPPCDGPGRCDGVLCDAGITSHDHAHAAHVFVIRADDRRKRRRVPGGRRRDERRCFFRRATRNHRHITLMHDERQTIQLCRARRSKDRVRTPNNDLLFAKLDCPVSDLLLQPLLGVAFAALTLQEAVSASEAGGMGIAISSPR